MKIWGALTDAVAGWLMILRGEPGWRARFSSSLPGLVTALVIFFFSAFLAIAAASTAIGMPGASGVLDALLVHGIWITALFVSIRVTAMGVKSEVATLDLLVPGIYLLVGYLLAGSLLNLILPAIVLVLTLALAYPLFRLARAATGWSRGISAAFGAATVLLLVLVPQALYMLTNPSL